MSRTILIGILLLLTSTAFATDRLVPSVYPTIQVGINAAVDGDTIIVDPGHYYENINFMGKAITVSSAEPGDWEVVESTIINGSQGSLPYGSCVVFDQGEGSSSILEGFTLTNGIGTDVLYSEQDRYFHRSPRFGGGILCLNGSPTIRRCNIRTNGVEEVKYGGGIALVGNCQAIISNCLIVNNWSECYGSGILICSNSPSTARSKITNCTISNNRSGVHYGRHWELYEVDCWNTQPSISNTIIWAGDSDTRSLFISDPLLVTYSCVKNAYIFEGYYDDDAEPYDLTAMGGNISDGPRFVQPIEPDLGGSGYIEPPPGDEPPEWEGEPEPPYYDEPDYPEPANYHLLPISPCINAGDPALVGGGETDIDGQPRVMGGRIDIGADEVVPTIIVNKPVGGEVWTSGSIHTIKWSSYGAGTLDILFSKDSGSNWQNIESSLADTGGYTWYLPDIVDSNKCLISVVPSVNDPNVVCIESGLFTIGPDFPDPVVGSRWKSLGGGFKRSGLSENYGPELGCVKWRFETNLPVFAGVTIGVDGRVVITCEDGSIYTLDGDGSLLWSYVIRPPVAIPTGPPWDPSWTYEPNLPPLSSPTIGPDGTVYVGSQDGKLYAIDINGNLRWTHTTDGFIYSSPAVSEDGKVYVCSQDGVLYALGQDGSELWSFETDGFGVLGGSIFASPAIGADGTVYIAGLYDPNLYALDPNDGGVKWACNLTDPCDPDSRTGWPFASPVVATDGTIYQTLLYDANLYAIDANNGDIIWTTNLSDTDSNWFEPYYVSDYPWISPRYNVSSSSWSEPALGPDGTIYVSFDDPYLRAVEPNGTIKWVTQLGMMGGFTLTVGSDGLIYAASDDAYLCVVNPDGEEIARFEGYDWLSFPVIAADNTIIVNDANNTVWAIGADDCEEQMPALHRPQDLNTDWAVNLLDFALLAADWLDCTDTEMYPQETEPPCDYYGDEIYLTGDVDRNLYVDFADIAALANRWLNGE